MNILFEQLFHCWCPGYDPDMVPPYLRNDPVRAYAQYTFEEGFRLGMCLAITCLNTRDLDELT